MNIFVLDRDPVKAAQLQYDRHVVKMILETAQLLSTAHRVLDGELTTRASKTGRKLKHWRHPNPEYEQILYLATHVNHPCNVWAREGHLNYDWLYKHFCALLDEYTYRYERVHKSAELLDCLSSAPNNIPSGGTPFKLCMGAAPECINEKDPVGSYRAFYRAKQTTTKIKMEWTKRPEFKQLLLG